MSVEINSDKDQKGRVKTGKRFRKREIKSGSWENCFQLFFYSRMFQFIFDSVQFLLLSLTHRIFIALLSDPDLWSVAEQILHSNGNYRRYAFEY